MTLEQKLGLTLLDMRKARHLSQDQFAQKAGISRRYLSDIENGHRDVSLSILQSLARVVGMSATELLLEVEYNL